MTVVPSALGGMSYVELIVETLRACEPIAEKHFGRASAVAKHGDRTQVVTEADVEIGHAIAAALSARFPDHNLLDEELGAVDHGSRFTWVIDPVDGTSNFAAGVPTYGMMIGLLDEGRPIACGISLPAFHQMYWAGAGGGAWRDGTRIAVDPGAELSSSLVAYAIDGRSDDPARTRSECLLLAEVALAARNVRCANSVYDPILVAEGKYGAWLCHSSRIWDQVAPHLLLQEAGGRYTCLDGSEVRYDRPLSRAGDNYDTCAGPLRVHQQLQELLRGFKQR
jgi:myo-inositol-1(or 4)-monophosphatase